MTEAQTPPPSIRHWLKKRGAPQTTVRWITKDGQQHEVIGTITGWGRTPEGVSRLVVTEHHWNGRFMQVGDKHTVASGALRRYLDSIGQTPKAKVYTREDYCGDCGKLLDVGGGNRYLDEFSGVGGLCYDCA